MNSPRPQNGFTLLEILVTIVIFGILSASVAYFLGQQNTLSIKTTDSQRSLNLAKLAMDSLKVAPYDSLVAGTDTVDLRYIRSWHVTTATDEDGQTQGSKKLEMTVYWPLTGGYSHTMATLVSDENFKDQGMP